MNVQKLAKSLFLSLDTNYTWDTIESNKIQFFITMARAINDIYYIREVDKEKYSIICTWCDYKNKLTQLEYDQIEVKDDDRYCPDCGSVLGVEIF